MSARGCAQYSCPRPGCNRIAEALFEVEYCRGLSIYDPAWMCGACLATLEAEERSSRGSLTCTMSDLAWGVVVLDQRGDAAQAKQAA